jgi:hypothetical protein
VIEHAAIATPWRQQMPERSLTIGEKNLLRDMFLDVIPFETQKIDTNDREIGGRGNSITPFGKPYISKDIWSLDYSAAPMN